MANSALLGHIGLEIQPGQPASTSELGVAVAAARPACAALPAPLQFLERGGGALLRLCPQLALRRQLEPGALQLLRLAKGEGEGEGEGEGKGKG